MGTSRDELVALIQALSLKKHMGIDVRDEVRKVVNMCRNEEDKKVIITLCRALGLDYVEK